ncbi:hypothetical protein CBR_g23570 [Chara braunii]|uniref:Uncharacterized protein n=1 Tax=Chara braunii TaxID=69332 RepID=A0A388L4S0_CHABU|nr:hypothetical protein CBR_g23570 [Chara braunii]|eukprot:GBG77242.1 hypothetical protein CBR_g23570 [Chara braunii]
MLDDENSLMWHIKPRWNRILLLVVLRQRPVIIIAHQVTGEKSVVGGSIYENANAYFNRGSAYDSLGDFDRAIADYTHALELDMAQSGDGEQSRSVSAASTARMGSVSGPAQKAIVAAEQKSREKQKR